VYVPRMSTSPSWCIRIPPDAGSFKPMKNAYLQRKEGGGGAVVVVAPVETVTF
jgi:hypothetical protein